MLIGKITDGREIGEVAVHREHTVGDDENAPRALGRLGLHRLLERVEGVAARGHAPLLLPLRPSELLRHGEKLTQLSGVQNTRFNEIMRVAEMHLAKGEYFLAQRKFNQALRFIPGHPLATAGLAHSNLGAGLHLSAGNVLQSVLSFQPEMIDVRYEANLLPPRIELVRAGVTASQRLDQERDGAIYAFLLAYIGHQLDDEEMLNKGLAALGQHVEEGDPFIPLLQRIWGASATTEPVQGE